MLFDQPIRLSQEQIQFYHNNGYLIVEDILNPFECNAVIAVLEFHAKISQNTDRRSVMNLDRSEEWRHVYGGPPNHPIHNYIRQMIIKNPRSVTVLETLHKVLPGDLVVMQTQITYKTAGTPYAAQAWNLHQDGYYHKAPYGGTLTGNIAFTDQDRENGCLFIYPGSHKLGRFLEAREVTSYHEKPGNKPGHDISQSLPKEFLGKEVDVNLKAGSLLALHGGVIHGSHPNVSKYRNRPMIQAPYKKVGIPFFPGNGISKRMEIPIR